MSRIFASTVVALALCITLAGCSNESADASDDLGVQKGRRPVPATTRQPPGPPDAKLVTEDDGGEEEDQD